MHRMDMDNTTFPTFSSQPSTSSRPSSQPFILPSSFPSTSYQPSASSKVSRTSSLLVRSSDMVFGHLFFITNPPLLILSSPQLNLNSCHHHSRAHHISQVYHLSPQLNHLLNHLRFLAQTW